MRERLRDLVDIQIVRARRAGRVSAPPAPNVARPAARGDRHGRRPASAAARTSRTDAARGERADARRSPPTPGSAVDLHTDETLDAGDAAGSPTSPSGCSPPGFPHPVTASHCVSLGVQPEAAPARGRRAGRRRRHPRRRPPADQPVPPGPRRAVVRCPAGSPRCAPCAPPGVQRRRRRRQPAGPVQPVGRGDPLETAGLMVMVGHLLPGDALATRDRREARHVLGLRDRAATSTSWRSRPGRSARRSRSRRHSVW